MMLIKKSPWPWYWNKIEIKDERQKQILLHLIKLRIDINLKAITDVVYRTDPILTEYYSMQNLDLREIKDQLENIKF